MAPWIFFLFVGVLDFGFFAYAAICTENAARTAALANSISVGGASDTAGACTIVLHEMNSLPNTRSLSCPVTTPGSTSNTNPLGVQATLAVGPDGANAAQVTVEYRTLPMIPIPGILNSQFTFTRTVQVRVLNATPTA